MEIRVRQTALAALFALGAIASAASQGEGEVVSERRFLVYLAGAINGEASVVVTDRADGSRVHHLRSALWSPREPGSIRLLEERVVSRGGRFLSGEARSEIGGERRVVASRLTRGAVEVQGEGRPSSRLEVPPGEIVWASMEAARHLALEGNVGDSLLVFDPGTGLLGRLGLVERREGGWAVMDELGVGVRYRFEPGERLPAEIHIDGLRLSYLPRDPRRPPAGATGARPLPVDRGVELEGRPARGSRVRLHPPEAFPGLRCEGGVGRLSTHGPLCPVDDALATASPLPPGPMVSRLAEEIPQGLAPEARARWLAATISERLSGLLTGAGMWEAEPERALAAGAGDCNEAAAVFMAAAPLIGLEARRRTGLVMDRGSSSSERVDMRPHAWVEVRLGGGWTRVDPERGEAPALGIYLDLGDGSTLSARMRTITAANMGGRVVVLED